MERDDQLGWRNQLLGRVMLESCRFGCQRDKTKCMYVEGATFMVGRCRAAIVRSLVGVVVIVTISVICCVVVGIRIQRHGVNRIKMLAR